MGDCTDFNIGTAFNQIRHGLRSPDGSVSHSYWAGNNTYRLTVISAAMPYYILKCEVLTRKIDDRGEFVWMARTSDNRIWKKKIHDMILEGRLTRSTT